MRRTHFGPASLNETGVVVRGVVHRNNVRDDVLFDAGLEVLVWKPRAGFVVGVVAAVGHWKSLEEREGGGRVRSWRLTVGVCWHDSPQWSFPDRVPAVDVGSIAYITVHPFASIDNLSFGSGANAKLA